MKNLKAFTLSETMIVIVVLGIVATLTIPALVNKNKESVAKTKVRKAMAAYESALNKMIIENDLKSDDTLTAWADANCANSTNYFKKVQDVNGCIFKTSDGIWWNISNIERPVISFKEINAGNEEQITANANNANDKTAFVLVGRFGTDGSLRVDDLAYETANSETVNNYKSYDQVAKLYNFLSGKKSSGGEETSEYTFASQRQKYLNGDFSTSCQELYGNDVDCWDGNICVACTKYEDDSIILVFDDMGNLLVESEGCSNYFNCSFKNTHFAETTYYECDENLTCGSSYVSDKNGDIDFSWLCDGNRENCSGISVIWLPQNGRKRTKLSDCNLDGSICSTCSGSLCSDYADLKTDEVTGEKYWSIKEQYRPTRNSNLTYSE